MKKVLIMSLIAFVLVGVIAGSAYMKKVSDYKKKVSALVINDVDLCAIKDGKYIGEYKADLVEAKVEVEIKDHKYQGIKLLEHKNGRGKPAEIIPSKVVEAQSLNVDTVSGATMSSKVILQAIQNALN